MKEPLENHSPGIFIAAIKVTKAKPSPTERCDLSVGLSFA